MNQRHLYALLVLSAAWIVACSGGGSSGTKGTTGSASGGASATGSGGSTAMFMSTSSVSGSSGTTCPGMISCTQKGYNCGMVGDGCGGTLDCGTCATPGDTCGGGGTPNVCGQPPCTKKTCMGLGFDCGMTSDGCNGTLDCGTCPTGQVCGGMTVNKCGTSMCMPKTCAQQGFNCGMTGDTCGNPLDCGSTCPTGQTCGGGGMANVCGAPVCTPKTCMQQGFDCGLATDGCNNIIDCGPVSGCMAPKVCGGSMPNVCSVPANCTGLCLQQMTCPGGGTTSISGTVFAPNGVDPVYDSLVYIPNGGAAPTFGVQPFAPGVHCGACGSEVSGSPLVSATTGVDGKFTITNVPVGTNIPLVIQNGRWRRMIIIPSVPACANTPLAAADTRFPQTEGEFGVAANNIPLMGFVTGSVDALECVLRKIGIADSQFSDPAVQGGTGRVRFYTGEGGPGSSFSGTTPSATQLWGTQAEINQYDMVYFACQGAQYDKLAANQQIVINYANAGGRVFATHFSYVWLYNDPPFSQTAQWQVGQGNPTPDPQTGFINQAFPHGQALAQWLQNLGATTTLGQMSINTLRHDFNNVVAPSSLWVSLGGTPIPPGTVPMHYTFETPVGAQPANQCGRVLFSDFHVEDANTTGTTFPTECANTPMTPQEKMLEFMIFDLGACVTPSSCAPKTCASQGAQCGPIGDGCGAIQQCGMCPAGQFCVNNQCQGCTPKTCQAQGFMCGTQGNGCGGSQNCGTCPVGQSCFNGVCSNGTCTPKTCASQGFTCGAQGDGCGNILMCGTCATNQTCSAGTCTNVSCTPKTCASQGFNCGLASDGCNNIIDCGMCPAGQTCGGGTPPKANVCGGSAA